MVGKVSKPQRLLLLSCCLLFFSGVVTSPPITCILFSHTNYGNLISLNIHISRNVFPCLLLGSSILSISTCLHIWSLAKDNLEEWTLIV